MAKKIGQGSENAKKFLADHPEIFDEIDHKVRVHFGLIEEDEAVKPLIKLKKQLLS